MKKTNLLLASIATIGLLASCGGPKTLTREQADAKVAAFDKTLAGTVKLTYSANYKMDVETENAGAKGFARDIKDVTTAELNLTEGDLYAHIKRVGRDATKETADKTLEALVYKNGDKYYFLKNTSAEPLVLPNEAAAKAKIDELLKATSSREGGYIDTKSLVYEGINTYEHRAFHLGSTNITIDDMDDPVKIEENEAGGVTVYSEPTYVGYGTDQGVSDLSAEPAANIVVNTNEKGLVTSYTETYNNASLTMPIFMPAPVLTISGTRALEATYGAEITRLSTIDHKRTTGTIKFTQNKKGEFQVFTCAPNDFQHMKPTTSGDAVDVDYWICIKVKPYGNNTVKAVLHNNSGTTLVDPTVAGGFYCFAVVEGDNMISVAFEGNDVKEEEGETEAKVIATLKVTKDAGVKAVKMVYYVYPTFNVTEDVPADGKLEVVKSLFVQVAVTCNDGKVVDTLKVNGTEVAKDAFGPGSGFNFSVKEGIDYNIVITTKAA